MKKLIILLAFLASNILLSQTIPPQLDYEIVEKKEGYSMEMEKPYNGLDMLKDSIYEWDTLYLLLNEPYFGVVVIGPSYNYNDMDFTWLSSTLGYILLVKGHEYNIGVLWVDLSSLANYVVIEENYTMNETDTLEFFSTDAVNEITLNPVDVDGSPFSLANGTASGHIFCMVPWGQGLYPFSMVVSEGCSSFFSDLSPNIKIQCSSIFYDVEVNNNAFFVEFPVINGIHENHVMINEPEDYIKTNLQSYFTNKEVDNMWLGFIDGVVFQYPTGLSGGIGGGVGIYIDNTVFWNGEIYLIRNESEDFDNFVFLINSTIKESDTYTQSTTPFLEILNDSIGSYYFEPSYNIYKAGSDDTLFFGDSPSTIWFEWQNNFYEMANIIVAGGTYGMLGEQATHKEGYFIQLKDESGSVIYESVGPPGIFYDTGEPGIFTLDVKNFNCPILNHSGSSFMSASFDLGADDSNPPIINPVQFRDKQNKPAFSINTNDSLTLLFSAADFNITLDSLSGFGYNDYQPVFDDSTRVFVKEYNSEIWQEISVEKYHEDSISGFYYRSDISGHTSLDSSALDLKISIADYTGNTAEFTICPAVLIDGFMITGETANFLFPEIDLNIYPNPTTSYINIQVSSENKSDMILNIYDVNGKLVVNDNFELIDGNNTFLHDLSNDQSGNKMKAGVYFCIFSIDHKTLTRKIILE